MFGFILFAAAAQVDLSNCPNYCSNMGECHQISEQTASSNHTSYICNCYSNFVGTGCQECSEGHYGSKCLACPSENAKICGGHGLCDSGKQGNGNCLCEIGFSEETNCVEEVSFITKWPIVAAAVGLLLSASILCVLMLYGLIRSPLHILPDSVGSILLGVVIGFAYVQWNPEANLSSDIFFDPQTFFLLVIPPIMFDAGYSSNKKLFFTNIGTILVFAVLGTIMASFLFGLLLYGICSIFNIYSISLLECMLFGSLISAVDPVATIAIFQALKVEPTLHMIVFGESVLNDAVSIAMFRVFARAAGTMDELDWGEVAWHFTTVFFGSIAVGVVIGLLSALVFKWTDMREYNTHETAMFLLWAYVPFVLCEAVGLSGILSILFLGMIMAHYTHFSLSKESKTTTHQMFRTFAFIAENFCFVYLGISVAITTYSIVWSMIALCIVLLLVSRGIVVLTLTPACNQFRNKPINIKNQLVIWFSGMRGAVAFSLALSMPTKDPDVIITTTQYLILFTIIVLGMGTYPLIKTLKIHTENFMITRHGDSVHKNETPDFNPDDKALGIFDKIEEFDKEYMQGWLRKEMQDDILY